jgi:hypothetical protein
MPQKKAKYNYRPSNQQSKIKGYKAKAKTNRKQKTKDSKATIKEGNSASFIQAKLRFC